MEQLFFLDSGGDGRIPAGVQGVEELFETDFPNWMKEDPVQYVPEKLKVFS